MEGIKGGRETEEEAEDEGDLPKEVMEG